MTSAAVTLLSLVLIALGLLGVILSFLVPDRKKSLIALAISGAIILVGVIQWSSQSFEQFRANRRMRDMQRMQSVDWEKLRERMKTQAAQQPNQPAVPVQPMKKGKS